MVAPLAVLLLLGCALSLIVGIKPHAWRYRTGDMRVRKLSGPNFATLLSVVGLSALLLRAAQLPFVARHPSAVPMLVGGAVLLLVGYVVVGSLTRVIVGTLAIVVLVLAEGVSATIALVVVSALALWLLGAVRGWLR